MSINEEIWPILHCRKFLLPVFMCSTVRSDEYSVYFLQAQCVCVCVCSLLQGPGTEVTSNRLFQHLGWPACCSDLSAAGRPAYTSALTAVLQLAVYYCRGPPLRPLRVLIATCQYNNWQCVNCVCVFVREREWKRWSDWVQSDEFHQNSLEF